MSEKIVSPGVFTREKDQTFLAQGISSIGGAFIGPFNRGPAFIPTIVNSQSDLESIFGIPDGKYYTPYAAQEYLRTQGQATLIRVGALGGYVQKNPLLIIGTGRYEYWTGSASGSISGSIYNSPYGQRVVSGTVPSEKVFAILSNTSEDLTLSGFDTGSFTLFTSSSSTNGYDGYRLTLASKKRLNLTVKGNTRFETSVYDGSSFGKIVVSSSAIGNEIVNGDADQNDSQFASVLVSGSLTGSIAPRNIVVDTYFPYSPNGGEYFTVSTGTPTSLETIYGRNPVSNLGKFAYLQLFFKESFKNSQQDNTLYNSLVLQESQSYYTELSQSYYYSSSGVANWSAGLDYWRQNVQPTFYPRTTWTLSAQVNDADDVLSFSDGVAGGSSQFDIRNASTPWILSQNVTTDSGNVRYKLFRFHTLNYGNSANKEIKVVIDTVKAPGGDPNSDYGSFNVGIRAYGDTDDRPNFLEYYENVNLDPNSPNFVTRRIGDRYYTINSDGKIIENGQFSNKSKYVYLELGEETPSIAIPYGFDSYYVPFSGEDSGGNSYAEKAPALVYSTASLSTPLGRYYSGLNFSNPDTGEYLNPVPFAESTGSNKSFALDDSSIFGSNTISPLFDATEENENIAKRSFALGFQRGFDGQSPNIKISLGKDITETNQQGLNCATSVSSGSIAYKKVIDALSNQDEWDFNLVVTPGIIKSLHFNVTQNVIDMVEKRGDSFYVADLALPGSPGNSSITSIVEEAAVLNTNYAATYYPWVKIQNRNTNKLEIVPPSVVIPSVYAQNDRLGEEWFAPAGLNRGGISQAVQVLDRLTHAERDRLYEGKVNPIVSFPGQGIVVWGQKTLQTRPSALDRINVRRLLITLKKYIASVSRYLVFEQNVAATRTRFTTIVNPYLESVQQRLGLYAFRVKMDETNNTPDVIDRNILYGQIFLQPTRTAEFIVLDFNITPTGASFDA